jgi:hypothetical protein
MAVWAAVVGPSFEKAVRDALQWLNVPVEKVSLAALSALIDHEGHFDPFALILAFKWSIRPAIFEAVQFGPDGLRVREPEQVAFDLIVRMVGRKGGGIPVDEV